ncbi:hypothetical protein SAMN05216419_10543 [Nitrosomonas cryotolerans]|uniref:Cas5fv helical domain-containing protein n=1 Tax=Nitrosomonas cryotolerans ATCC 49181 TaxID=1131553 RepID=A0A1N6HFR9_9PROT|nr:type I-Fv CRISPR-associated protein Cas5fv [Nitrosomonas cryotolerans]SFQ06473.1 hypothetical protein SAMN05216419_10543 [Nitrosomonas cryotolerans]SIO18603.1 hypothetical protein SAMN02743940_1164 [Nitrosomonas cryotolerans ATCC 49181]
MRITIKYEAAWQNSFLDGSNNEPLPKSGRGFVGSMTNLSKRDSEGQYSNFIERKISKNTIMGILNRLIGDQRKLYQAKQDQSYFFMGIEDQISFENSHDRSKPINTEMVYIRNITGSTDQNAFTGMIKATDPAFSSVFSGQLWGVLHLELCDVLKLINDPGYTINNNAGFDPLTVINQFELLGGFKDIDVTGEVEATLDVLKLNYPDINYELTAKGQIKPIILYCSALYLQIGRLEKSGYDLSTIVTKKGGLSGISKRGFTLKDFMDRYTTGSKKKIWGNPYLLKEKRKGEGEVTSLLTKANGTLEIQLDIPQEKAQQLKDMIEAAGVSSFYLGKKGLAYIDSLRI